MYNICYDVCLRLNLKSMKFKVKPIKSMIHKLSFYDNIWISCAECKVSRKI